MRHQLEHLLDGGRAPGVTLQVLPFACGAHAGHDGPFSILEFPNRSDSEVVYVESMAGPIYLEKDREVRARAEAFDRLRAAALPPEASARPDLHRWRESLPEPEETRDGPAVVVTVRFRRW